MPTASQNTVDRSRSSIAGRWTRAAPSAGSVSSAANDATTIAMPATPYSVGVRSRARTTTVATRVASETPRVAAFQTSAADHRAREIEGGGA